MDHDRLLAEIRGHVDRRLDRIEEKLDTILPQVSQNTESIAWLKGSSKIIITGLLSTVGSVILLMINWLRGS